MTTPLPPTDPPSSDEQLPGEAELAVLYRQLPQNEPPAALDRRVMQAATAALYGSNDATVTDRRSGPREAGDWVHPRASTQAIPSITDVRRRTRTPRWLLALGSAASLVLVAGLAWQLHGVSPLPTAPVAQEPASAPAPGMAKASADVAPPAASAAPAPVMAKAAPDSATRQNAMRTESAAKAQRHDDAPSMRRQSAAGMMAAPAPLAEVSAAVPPAPPAPSASFTPPAPPAPPAPPTPQRAAAPIQQAADQMQGDPAGRILSAPPSAGTPVNEDLAARDNVTAQQPGDTPAQELAKIEKLFAQGHRDQALPRLRAFHLAHSQWSLSPALQAQLQEP